MPMDVAVIRTGVANLASILAGLRRSGAEPRLTDDPREVSAAARVVLPGVGAFAAAMAELGQKGLAEPVRERIRSNRPTLAICLGLQLLAEGSEESPGVGGLRVFSGSAARFTGNVRVPQLGWNEIVPDAGCRFLERGYAYFANSYRLAEAPSGWSVAWAEHGERFVAAMERGAALACQFHPELSGAWGLRLLQRWLAAPPEEVRSC